MRIPLPRLLLVFVATTMIGACAAFWGAPRQGVSSSLVDFLYPKGEQPPPPSATVPHLDLPVRVGLAFVPSNDSTVEGLSEVHKAELLAQVKQAFSNRDFIADIQIIPEAYLRSTRGFDSVDQVARLYQLAVIALVSYDQVAITDETKASIAYWTIIGAYFIKGNKNDVQTFVDTAVFDVKTHSLLFRAAGTDTSRTTSTLVDTPETVRNQRAKSFSAAMADMTTNLANELDVFRERVKNEQVITVSDGGKGGSLDPLLAAVLVILLWANLRRVRERT
jgi:rhombotail lipoprotein